MVKVQNMPIPYFQQVCWLTNHYQSTNQSSKEKRYYNNIDLGQETFCLEACPLKVRHQDQGFVKHPILIVSKESINEIGF
jgi:hypothetical protein